MYMAQVPDQVLQIQVQPCPVFEVKIQEYTNQSTQRL